MAKKDESKTKKADKKPKTSLRERNQKVAAAKEKPRRIRRAAASAGKPVSQLRGALKKEYHVLPQKDEPGFFTKSRRITPSYFVKSYAELRQVTWPGRKETWKLVFAVFAFAITIGVFISLLDYGIGKLFREIIL